MAARYRQKDACTARGVNTGRRFSMIALLVIVRGLVTTPGPSGVGAKHFKIGFLSHEAIPIDGPAISLAIEKYGSHGMLRHHNFSIAWRAGVDTDKSGLAAVIELIADEGADVILGARKAPACITGGYVADYLNKPFLPLGCADVSLSNKNTFSTLMRVVPSMSKLGGAVAEMFLLHGWRRAVVVATDGYPCGIGAKGILKMLTRKNLSLSEWIDVPVKEQDWDMEQYLQKVRRTGRIVLLCLGKSIEPIMKFLLLARKMGMTSEEYVYIYYTTVPREDVSQPWLGIKPEELSESQLALRKEVSRSLKQITVADLAEKKIQSFIQALRERLADPPWLLANATKPDDVYTLFLHDAALLYLDTLNEILTEGGNYEDGALFFEKARLRTLQGQTGGVKMDQDGDREPNFWIWSYQAGQQSFATYAVLHMTAGDDQKVQLLRSDVWGTESGLPPPDTPQCGYTGELCRLNMNAVIVPVSVVAVLTLLSLAISVYFYKRHQVERQIQQMLWRIKFEELDAFKVRTGSEGFHESVKGMRSLLNVHAMSTSGSVSESVRSEHHGYHGNASLARFRGSHVLVYRVNKPSIHLTRDTLLELKMMREMTHENLLSFVGACIDPPHICYMLGYCSKGSLQDILQNDDIKLDWVFKSSLINDLLNGLCSIHDSSLRSHGNLKSDNCLVDSRWALKVSGFGLAVFRDDDSDKSDYEKHRELLWTAPELLRALPPPVYGTPVGDVYSVGIVMQEILFRCEPFFGISDPRDIVENVRRGGEKPYRPEGSLATSSHDPHTVYGRVVALMKKCWIECPDERPFLSEVRRQLRLINKGEKTNIMDNMVQKLERYSMNLEEIVQHRTAELVEEKKKTDRLLYRMLPESVADKLKRGETVAAELYEGVTIYFSDIVGFTSIASESTPMEVVNILNDLYSMFDDAIAIYDVYKVETIGDAYMVASGAPKRNDERHVVEIANITLHLLRDVSMFRIRHMPERPMQIRIGMHTGPCAAGVVGLTMPRYCLFGDTVNMASRMESTGLPNRVHVSAAAYRALSAFPEYQLSLRGQTEVKGKGAVPTYWLTGRAVPATNLPRKIYA